MAMTRTQIYLTEEQSEQVKRLAEAQHKTMAEVIREAVKEYIVQRSAKQSVWWDIVNLGYSGITDGSIHHDRDIYDED
ncbi:MAG: CopG family transcriptional regulator [Chloroflexi bacterium]|nr:CopG family transcriptional regulator [Chloroflexota bacterium]